MWRNAWLWGVSVGLAGSVLAAASLVIAQEAPPRLRGTLDQVSGNALTIKARNGPCGEQMREGERYLALASSGGSSIDGIGFDDVNRALTIRPPRCAHPLTAARRTAMSLTLQRQRA
jgi:hypothetical protein